MRTDTLNNNNKIVHFISKANSYYMDGNGNDTISANTTLNCLRLQIFVLFCASSTVRYAFVDCNHDHLQRYTLFVLLSSCWIVVVVVSMFDAREGQELTHCTVHFCNEYTEFPWCFLFILSFPSLDSVNTQYTTEMI